MLLAAAVIGEDSPPFDLHLVFEKFSLKNQVFYF